jgi:hypothetical protein
MMQYESPVRIWDQNSKTGEMILSNLQIDPAK